MTTLTHLLTLWQLHLTPVRERLLHALANGTHTALDAWARYLIDPSTFYAHVIPLERQGVVTVRTLPGGRREYLLTDEWRRPTQHRYLTTPLGHRLTQLVARMPARYGT
ncbi:hypothetical protein [Deinococcus soli (ex Cha et al. 2016)]|uniref:hypothetical protein n=1 Tax=Deinococcus soli (ex Cha et al. 2016) TaxID=1309411 RepID=UPI00166E6CF6|nr:hypothetical protein [Deinococcus soli (ex Cha et al. 2016)]GGB69279.1 hypothetical protein GCM10008019_26840 [Deinococcus soli (ex Cha et al. 2016)]